MALRLVSTGDANVGCAGDANNANNANNANDANDANDDPRDPALYRNGLSSARAALRAGMARRHEREAAAASDFGGGSTDDPVRTEGDHDA